LVGSGRLRARCRPVVWPDYGLDPRETIVSHMTVAEAAVSEAVQWKYRGMAARDTAVPNRVDD
jgi:hypothetical protein